MKKDAPGSFGRLGLEREDRKKEGLLGSLVFIIRGGTV